MTFEDLSKQLNTSVQSVPNLVQVLSAGFADIEGGGGGGSSHDYSTEERVVGKWIDGRDVYEKVIPLSFTLSTGIATIPIEYNGTIIDKSGIAVDTNGSVLNLFGHVNAEGLEYCMGAWFDSTGLRVRGGSIMQGNYTGHVIIRYVKPNATE